MPDIRKLITRKPSAEPATELEELLNQVRIAYRSAGEPSYRNIARITGRRLSPSTISRIFRATTPPKWFNLELLLTALGVPAQDLKTVWHPLWAKAQNTVNPITDPTAASQELISPAPQDTTCVECGAAIADLTIHRKWHERLGRANDVLEALERYSKRPMPAQLRARVPGRTARMPAHDPAAPPGS